MNPKTTSTHGGMGPPGWRCKCGTTFDDYYALAEHLRLSINCPSCEAAPATTLADREVARWQCGHWIMRGDFSATLRAADETPDHYPTYGPDADHVACACGHTVPVFRPVVSTLKSDANGFTDALERVNAHVRTVQHQS
jgi:hypothetical protein